MECLEQVLTFPEPYIWKIHGPHLLSVVLIWFLPSKQKEIEYANHHPSQLQVSGCPGWTAGAGATVMVQRTALLAPASSLQH